MRMGITDHKDRALQGNFLNGRKEVAKMGSIHFLAPEVSAHIKASVGHTKQQLWPLLRSLFDAKRFVRSLPIVPGFSLAPTSKTYPLGGVHSVRSCTKKVHGYGHISKRARAPPDAFGNRIFEEQQKTELNFDELLYCFSGI